MSSYQTNYDPEFLLRGTNISAFRIKEREWAIRYLNDGRRHTAQTGDHAFHGPATGPSPEGVQGSQRVRAVQAAGQMQRNVADHRPGLGGPVVDDGAAFGDQPGEQAVAVRREQVGRGRGAARTFA